MDLRWLAGDLASCFRAAEVLCRTEALADAALAAALTAPVHRLLAALHEERIPLERFFAHLIPLAAGNVGLHQLAEVTLIKTMGRTAAPSRVRRFWDLLSDLKNALATDLPDFTAKLSAQIEPFQGRWYAHGAALLGGIVAGSEAGLLVREATVVLVHPVQGGGGAAYLPYNTVCLEAVAEDPISELPEVVRLAWMLATLNLDLPRYSENIQADRLATAAALAMIPMALAVAADLRLAGCDEAAIKQAVVAWMPPAQLQRKAAAEWAALLAQWHATYRAMRPPLSTALKGLDVLIQRE
jgi:hypothetical protein